MKGLLICYWFPPKESIASQRTLSFYRHLNSNGIKTDVICPDWGPDFTAIPGTMILGTHQVNKKAFEFKRNLKTKIKEWIFYKIFKYNYFRDSKKGTFYREAMKKISGMDLSSYDFILTSYNPLDVIHIGAEIKNKYPKLKWIIDYRDYYSLNHYMDFGIFRNYFKSLERRITRNADGFVTVSNVLCKGISELIKKDGIVVYNGFEMTSVSQLSNAVKSKLNLLPIISYCGSLYAGKRDIDRFFSFYKRKGLDQKFQFVFALLNEEDLELVQATIVKYDLQNLQVFTNLTYNDSLALMNDSKYLMMFSDFDSKSNGFLSGKVFEYMSFSKPVIYSGNTDNYELYELFKATDLGESFEIFDFGGNTVYSSNVSEFTRANQTNKLIHFIHQICNKNE